MEQSKFDKFTVIYIYGVAIVAPVLIVLICINGISGIDKFLIYFGFPLVGLGIVLLWIIELPKIKIIQITQTEIKFINPISKREKSADLTCIDGYKKQFQQGRFGINSSIFIYKDGKLLQEISSLYIKNFDELEKQLKSKIRYLGTEKFRYFDYLIREIKRKIGT